jgi:hypothetical protein
MVIGADAQREARSALVRDRFGRDEDVALDLLAIADSAWHDTYGDLAIPDDVLDDLRVVSSGDVRVLVSSLTLALQDWRDLRLNADAVRSRSGS